MNVNFVESNPIPVKAAMALMGLLEPVFRLPMVPPSRGSLAKIEKVLEAVGLAREGARCRLKSKQLFDDKPAAYTRRPFPTVRRVQSRAERRAACAPPSRTPPTRHRLARERLGEERHSAGLPHGRHRRYVDRSPRGSPSSISPPTR